MAENYEDFRDVSTEKKSASSSLMEEVYSDRQSSNRVIKDSDSDSSTSSKIDALLGSLEIFGDNSDSKQVVTAPEQSSSKPASVDAGGDAPVPRDAGGDAPVPRDAGGDAPVPHDAGGDKPTQRGDHTPPPAAAPEKPVDLPKMEADARTLHEACGTFSNNNETIYKMLEGKTPEELQAMNEAFKKEYGVSIKDYLNDEMKRHPDELKKAMELLAPIQKLELSNQATLEKDSDTIYKALGVWDDEDKVLKTLEGKTPQELEAMNRDFLAKHGKTMEAYIREHLDGENLTRALDLLHNGAADTKIPGADYKGETIKKDVQPSKEIWVQGTTLEDIAKKKLGDGASTEDINNYVREIKKLNNIKDNNPTGYIDVPGHNQNGELITLKSDGTKKTIAQDGSVKVENPNGTSYDMKPLPNGGFEYHHRGPKPEDNYAYTRTPDGHGGYTEKHTGSKPEDNYEITRTPDGHYKIKDAQGERSADKFDEGKPDPRVEKAKLLDEADAHITDPEKRAKFHENLQRFEERARAQNMSPEEQAKFYHQVNRLLDAKDNPENEKLPKAADRVKLAEQIMSHAADPHQIDQGNHGSCGVAAMESQMYTKSPSEAARIVTDVATTGSFTGADGKKVTPDSSLIPADAQAKSETKKDGERDYASQLFQDSAISVVYGSYKRVEPDPNKRPPDNGDRHQPRGSLQTAEGTPGLTPDELARINEKISGDRNMIPILEGNNVNEGDGQIHVNSEQELKAKLAEFKEQGKLPAIILVNSNHEPFLTDSGKGSGAPKAGSEGLHYVTITDYDPKTGAIKIDNQWGRDSDHTSVTTQELFLATKKGDMTQESVKELQKIVDENRKNHTQNPMLELELARAKHSLGMYKNEAEYEAELTKILVDARTRWKKDEDAGRLSLDEKNRVDTAFSNLVAELPEDAQTRVEQNAYKRSPTLKMEEAA